MNISTDVDWPWKTFLLRCEITFANGTATKNRLFFVGEFSARGNLDFPKAEVRGARARPIPQSTLVESLLSCRTLLVRKRLKCPVRIETGATTAASKASAVNSRNLERVRRQIIGVSICRNICRNIDIPRGTCCFVRISVVPSDSARVALKFIENVFLESWNSL